MRERVSTINKVKVDLEVDWKNEMDAQAAANKKEEEKIAKELFLLVRCVLFLHFSYCRLRIKNFRKLHLF